MTMHQLVSEVQSKTALPRELILCRAREAWPGTIEFKDVQVRLLIASLGRERNLDRAKTRPTHVILPALKPVETGWVSAACQRRTQNGCTHCFSLKCSCVCHTRVLPAAR